MKDVHSHAGSLVDSMLVLHGKFLLHPLIDRLYYSKMPVRQLLPALDALTSALRRTNSILEKKRILSDHPETHHFLRCLFTSGPLFVTSKSIEKDLTHKTDVDFTHLFDQDVMLEDLLKKLARRSVSGHAAIKQVQALIAVHPTYAQLIKDIIDKDLRIRMGPKLILDAVGTDEDARLPVALAEDWKDEKIRAVLERSLERTETWFASRKLDGVRCLAVIERRDGKIEVNLRSRQGKSLDRLESIRSGIADMLADHKFDGRIILDGELCCFEGDIHDLDMVKENFRKAAGQVGKLEACPTEKLTFVLFDMLRHEELTGVGRALSERLATLSSIKPLSHADAHTVVLPQMRISSQTDFETALARSRQFSWEGLMVRKDAPFLGRRSRDLIKCKDFVDAEFCIVGYKLGLMRTIVDGTETTQNLLSSITIEYKGSKVDVGSGFSFEERRCFKEMGDGLLGRMVTICYFEESSNKVDGKPSLRFPIFKSLYQPT